MVSNVNSLQTSLEIKLNARRLNSTPRINSDYKINVVEDFDVRLPKGIPESALTDAIIEHYSAEGTPFLPDLSQFGLHFNRPNSLLVVNSTYLNEIAQITAFEFKGFRY